MKKSSVNSLFRESVSTVIDGEANDIELHRVLANIENDELRQVVKNYQLAGDVIRKQNTSAFTTDLSKKIRDSIHKEPSLAKKQEKLPSKLSQRLTRVAIAASVTMAVIIGFRSWNSPSDQQQLLAGNQQSLSEKEVFQGVRRVANYGAQGLLAGSQAKQISLTPKQLTAVQHIADAQTIKRFKAYSLNHAEQVSNQNMQGTLSLIRVVSFPAH